MSIDKYTVFLKIVELGSLTKAAEELGYTQSSVSYILSSLEDSWNIKLLSRDRAGLHLTSEGMRLLPRIQAVCEKDTELQNELNDLHGLEAGLIRIGTFASTSAHWLPGIIKTFNEQYANIDFKLYHGSYYSDIERWLASGVVDCGFLRIPTQMPLESHFLMNDKFVAILPTEHPFARASAYPIDRFTFDSCIQLEDGKDMEVSNLFREWKLTPNTKYTLEDDYTVLAMVEAGLGVALMPELVVRNTSRNIIIKPLDHDSYRKIGIAVKSAEFTSTAVKRFIEHVKLWVTKWTQQS